MDVFFKTNTTIYFLEHHFGMAHESNLCNFNYLQFELLIKGDG